MGSCSSGKKALQRGNYDEAVLKSINRLRSSPNNGKARNTLEQAYPLSVSWHQDNITRFKQSGENFRWEKIATEYSRMNNNYTQLNRCPACLTIINNAISFDRELRNANLKAAEARYKKGDQMLVRYNVTHDILVAREAYQHFKVAYSYVPEYRDVRNKMEKAKFLATLKIVVKPIPMHSRSLELSNEFFQNKIHQYLHEMPVNEFVRFYSSKEAKNLQLNQPDQIISLKFDDFVVGQTYLKEKEIQVSRDSVILATISVEGSSETINLPTGRTTPKKYETQIARSKSTLSPTNEVVNQSAVSMSRAEGKSNQAKKVKENKDKGTSQQSKGKSDKKVKENKDKGASQQSKGKSDKKVKEKKDKGASRTNKKTRGEENKLIICHKIPGSLGRFNTIEVSKNALQHHLDHGDVKGKCSPKNNAGNAGNGKGKGKDESKVEKEDRGTGGQRKEHNQRETDRSISYRGKTKEPKPDPGYQNVYGTVKATVHVFNKTVTSRGLLDFKIIDANTKKVLVQDKFPGEFVWFTEWGYFNGDERALDDYFLEVVQSKEVLPSPPQDLFIAFTEPIYLQLTERIKQFYRNY